MSHKTMLDTILVNLKILSKVGENGKISSLGTSGTGQISIAEPGYLTPIWRYIHGDSRQKTIETINDIVNNAIQISNNMLQNTCMTIYDNQDTPSSYEVSKFNKQFQSLKSISTELENSLKGINNLKITYKNDATISSQIEVIITSIQRQVTEIENKLEFSINNKKNLDSKKESNNANVSRYKIERDENGQIKTV